jgi:2,4-dienoyl-CoA reductase-like NADH-dependent reductase (Old Yellow Enzyme family)
MPTLLDPITLGDLSLRNRVIMAPLTRSRAVDRRIPNDLMAEYYAQRSSAGMILAEAAAVSPTGVGYANTPGIPNSGWCPAPGNWAPCRRLGAHRLNPSRRAGSMN